MLDGSASNFVKKTNQFNTDDRQQPVLGSTCLLNLGFYTDDYLLAHPLHIVGIIPRRTFFHTFRQAYEHTRSVKKISSLTVRSNTRYIHRVVTPSAAWQPNQRLHPHRGIKGCRDCTIVCMGFEILDSKGTGRCCYSVLLLQVLKKN